MMNKVHTEWELPLDPELFEQVISYLYLTRLSKEKTFDWFKDNWKSLNIDDEYGIIDYWDDLIVYE